jgi:hypothetical protein
MKTIRSVIMMFVLTGWVTAEEVEIRPSVWGTEKWYGGYEVYAKDKKIGEIRPSVWGTKEWPGGYELYRGERKVGEAKASEWGQDVWYGGYKIEIEDRTSSRLLDKVLRSK